MRIKHWKNKSLKTLSEVVNGILYVEEWKPIIGYEIFYHISSFGRVKSLERNMCVKNGSYIKKQQILCGRILTKGYLGVRLYNSEGAKQFKIHRLVAFYFVAGFDVKYQVNHEDGDKKNNSFWNLKGVTGKENIEHSWTTGLRKYNGENSPLAKLTNKQAIKIYKSEEKMKDLAQKYGVSYSCINAIKNGYKWGKVINKNG